MLPLPIGQHETGGRVFSILAEDRRKHMAILGKTGVGKTTLLYNMIRLDIQGGLGVTVIDPHGSLIRDLLNSIPPYRTNDVVYLNPLESSRVPGINILEPTASQQKPLVLSSLISTLRNIWPDSWGPRTEYILSNAAFALLEQAQPVSLLALPKLLTDRKYRQQILRSVTDPVVQSFFHTYDHQWPDRFREEAIAPLLNKVYKFSTPLLRPVIGQTKSAFDFRWLIDQGKILLCDLSKGLLGEDISSLLGSLIVTKLFLAALSRQDLPEDQRRPHILYCDEIQTFTHGVSLPAILSEARKYKLVVTAATQSLTSLSKESVNAILANCATLVSFRLGAVDAQMVAKEFGMTLPGMILPASQLQDLPDYKIYISTLMAGQPSGPHLLQTFPPASAQHPTRRDRVIRTSLERFSRPRAQVETRINKFLAR